MTFSLDIPAVYLDNLSEDDTSAPIALINRNPEGNERDVPRSSTIMLDIASLTSAPVDLSSVVVYVGNAVAFDGGFAPGFHGADSYARALMNGDVRMVIAPEAGFFSQAVVVVRVLASLSNGAHLEESYAFTIEDATSPRLARVEAIDVQRIRVTFDEPIDAASALEAAHWSIARLGDYVTPIASVEVASVETTPSVNVIDLLADIPLTFAGSYRLTASPAVIDAHGNPVDPAFGTRDFLGFDPPQPAGRDFDLYARLPRVNRLEDDTQDLLRFVGCVQEVSDLLLYSVDRWIDILDPDTAPEFFVDAMLADLGNPFVFDLTVAQKRKLALVLSEVYALKGTDVGIVNVVRFFLGIEVEIDALNDVRNLWELGTSALGEGTFLDTGDLFTRLSFRVRVAQSLTAAQRRQISAIVDYMRPAQTHFIELVEPVIPVYVNHAELGLSRLGVDFFLHGAGESTPSAPIAIYDAGGVVSGEVFGPPTTGSATP